MSSGPIHQPQIIKEARLQGENSKVYFSILLKCTNYTSALDSRNDHFNATIVRKTSLRRRIEIATSFRFIARRCAHPVGSLIVRRRGVPDGI
jgi:hypothetical protein